MLFIPVAGHGGPHSLNVSMKFQIFLFKLTQIYLGEWLSCFPFRRYLRRRLNRNLSPSIFFRLHAGVHGRIGLLIGRNNAGAVGTPPVRPGCQVHRLRRIWVSSRTASNPLFVIVLISSPPHGEYGRVNSCFCPWRTSTICSPSITSPSGIPIPVRDNTVGKTSGDQQGTRTTEPDGRVPG
jgi:hypothetical protein